MTAKPITPGLIYAVTHAGQQQIVFARHPVDALLQVLEQTGAQA